MTTIRLGDLGEVVTGTTPPSKQDDLYGEELPFLTPTDMSFEARHVTTERGLSEAGAERFRSRLVPSRSVAVVCIGATIGKVCMIQDKTLTNQQINTIVVDESRHSPEFIYYLLRTRGDRLRAVASGAATPIVNKTVFGSIEVDVPPLEVQREISTRLTAFDDLIENNRRRIEILEEMARLIYREWFVHFRFPGHEDVELVDSDLGPIPEGWEHETLADAAHLVMGQSPKSEFYNDDGIGLPFHQGVTNFGSRYPEHKKWCTQENRIAEEGDVLLSVRAPVGRINVAPDRLVIGRGLAALRSRRDTQVFLFETLREVFAEEDSMGGGTIFKAVTKKDLERITLVRPPSSVATAFENAVGPMFDLVRNLTRQNRVLAEARDLLLPRLISGELDVSGLDLDLEPVA